LPDKFPAPTQLESLYPKTLKDLDFPEVENLYKKDGIKEFSPILTQTFSKIYNSRDSIFIGSPVA